MRRLMILALLLITAGCADRGQATMQPTEAFTARAATIDRAWHGALTGPAGDAWRTGLVPLQNLTVAPGEITDAQRASIAAGWYAGGASLPGSAPADGQVHFPAGAAMTVPLISAAAAYRQMRRGDPPCGPSGGSPAGAAASGPAGARAGHDCAVLTVVGARLGQTTLRTSRGDATVPAWLFTVRELAKPIARAAFDVTATTPVTYPAVPAPSAGELTGVAGAVWITGGTGRRVEFTIAVGPCDGDPVGLVYETDETVVVAARTTPAAKACDGSLTYEPIAVSLKEPLGSRPVFDALTGRPLTPR
jgi:hypothetical protein